MQDRIQQVLSDTGNIPTGINQAFTLSARKHSAAPVILKPRPIMITTSMLSTVMITPPIQHKPPKRRLPVSTMTRRLVDRLNTVQS